MKLFYSILLLFVALSFCGAQTFCQELVAVQPTFEVETVEVMVSAAEYRTEYTYIITKDAHWKVETVNGVLCRVFVPAEKKQVLTQIQTKSPVYEKVAKYRKGTDGEIVTVTKKCG